MKNFLSIAMLSGVMVTYSAEKSLPTLDVGILQTSIIQQTIPTIIERTQKAQEQCNADRLTAARFFISFWSYNDQKYLESTSEQKIIDVLTQRNITINNINTKLKNSGIVFEDVNKEKIEQILHNRRNATVACVVNKKLPSIYYPSTPNYPSIKKEPTIAWGSQTQDITLQLQAMEDSKKQDTKHHVQLLEDKEQLIKRISKNNQEADQIAKEMTSIQCSPAIQQLCERQITLIKQENTILNNQQLKLECTIKQAEESLSAKRQDITHNGEEIRRKYDDAVQKYSVIEQQENELSQQLIVLQQQKDKERKRIERLTKVLFGISQNNVERALKKEL